MKKTIAVLASMTLAAFLITCGSDEGTDKTVSNNPIAETTEAGALTGGAADSATIGASGGTLSVDGGRIEIIVPSGALSSDTEITARQITNMAFGGIGAAYRFGPAGTTFAKPITLKFSASAGDMANSNIGTLGIAFQDSDGYWNLIPGATVDATTKTVTVTTDHFSDYAPVAVTLLNPLSKTVKPGESVSLELTSCYPIKASTGGEDWRGYHCDNYIGVLEDAVEWGVDATEGGNSTVGTVSGSSDSATYTAPSKKPSPATVNVYARIVNSDLPELNQVKVYSQVTIEDSGDFTGTITITETYLGQVFTVTIDDATLTVKDDGIDETNYTLTGTAKISPATFMIGDAVFTLAESANKTVNEEYGFKVLKTDPPTVRWSFIEGWEYSSSGSPFGVTISYSTSACGDGDVDVSSLDDIDGSYTMGCYLGAGAAWNFTANK